MTVLKWALIIFGVLFLALAAGVFGLFYWGTTVEAVKVTTADLEVGGSYPDDEREALYAACNAKLNNPGDAQTGCRCLADRAGSDLTRFGRMELTATFQGDLTQLVALGKGLSESGIPEARSKELQEDSSQRIQQLLAACGFAK